MFNAGLARFSINGRLTEGLEQSAVSNGGNWLGDGLARWAADLHHIVRSSNNVSSCNNYCQYHLTLQSTRCHPFNDFVLCQLPLEQPSFALLHCFDVGFPFPAVGLGSVNVLFRDGAHTSQLMKMPLYLLRGQSELAQSRFD